MTETCERWSIALEQERQGELPPGERAALERHLAGCARCTAERADIASLADGLESPVAPGGSWDDLRSRIERVQRRRQREIGIGLIAALAIGAALVLVRGKLVGAVFDAFGSGLVAGMAFAIVVACGAAWLAARRTARASPGTDLIASIRRQYERRIRGTRFFAIWGPIYLAFVAFTASPRLFGTGSASVVVRGALVAAAIAGALNAWFRVIPKLQRELREMEGK